MRTPFAASSHALVLAENPLSHDTRILKQIASLAEAGYQVSTFAQADDALPDHDLEHPGRHVYRFQIDWKTQDMLEGCRGPTFGLYEGLIGELLGQYERAQQDLVTLRKALRLHRLFSALHWSSKVRKHRRREHRSLRNRIVDMVNDRVDCPSRISLIARYEAAASAFSETSAEWTARVEQLGAPKLVHAHDIYTLAAGLVLARKYGARLIYDAHEYEPERAPLLPLAMRRVIESFEDRVLPECDGLITVSESIAGLYRERHPNLDVRLVKNCPDQRALNGDVAGLRERTVLDADIPLVVFVGLAQLESRGIQVVLDALHDLPDAHFVIIGPRWKAVDTKLKAAVQTSGLESRVHLLDPVAPHDVIAAIRDADVSVCLIQDTTQSYRYSMPNKLFESLLAGVPAIVSDFPDMGGFIRKHNAGLVVDETNPRAVADAIRAILADRAAFVPAGAARAALEADASWESQEGELLSLYQHLTEKIAA